jgi:aminopeptidase N
MPPVFRYIPSTLALLCLLTVGTGYAAAEERFNLATTPGKLPKNAVPLAYRIDLAPDLQALTFTGREEVELDITKPTATLTLNAASLAFVKVTLIDGDKAAGEVSLDEKAETATIRFPHALAVGRHSIAIDYTGLIPAQPHGLYYNDFDTAQGRQRMLITQFEATSARYMFPGWDEPAFKARYTLSVTLPAGFAAVSNTPIASSEPDGAVTKVRFGETPRMSSYLLVLAAGPLDRIHEMSAAADIGVWSVAGKAELGRYALGVASKILPYYNDYFGVPYPLPKLDLIAIPGNFSAGAMENWGGITFIDNDIHYDPASSSPETRERDFSVIAHEMAHQWSGDLVTMGWWNDTWLNEGFATWMAAKATDHFNPDWQIWLRTRSAKEEAMAIDARRTTHPIQQPIHDDSEIGLAFDSINYEKGAAFIRMLENYLGEASFRDGMRRYMKAHAYSNSTTADLWSALEAASGKPVAKIAAGFTEQPGVPLISIASDCVKDRLVATLTQSRFTIHDPDAAKLSWRVPVAIGAIGGEPPRTLLVGDKPETVSFAGCARPVQANFGDVGYYRVEYAPSALQALAAAYTSLPAANRATLLADQWALVEAGRASPATYLDLTKQLGGETELVVWRSVLDALHQIDNLLRGAPERDAFRAYGAGLIHPVLDRLGWDPKPGETSEAALLRGSVIDMLGRFGDAGVIAESKKRFEAFLADPASLSPSLREAVLDTIGRGADQALWDKLRALGNSASGTEEKLRYYYALAGARDPALVDQGVGIGLTDEIAIGRVNRFLGHEAAESDDPNRVWHDVQTHLDPILNKLGKIPGMGSRGSLLPMIARASNDPAIAAELLAQPEVNATSGARRGADRAAEDIAAKAELRARLLPALSEWLQANHGS